eukprot:CAMPEP_0184052366 /NCGR_PEP_ID=MMETSP0956-20121227/5256_1 /TAXON_ID=627963 /ORGANISM="Aplanochytrium sp, Strain PBS07" /LENGTH=993 /DNA_ID=CAMNT_0026345421 /DNA_START=198 /DNA_END=3179 /DNA_ORIENTATION=+
METEEPLTAEVVEDVAPVKPKLVERYASCVTGRPYSCFFLCLFVMLLLSGLPFLVRSNDLPDFDDPSKGLEARGTVLSGSYRAFENLRDSPFRRQLKSMERSRRMSFAEMETDVLTGSRRTLASANDFSCSGAHSGLLMYADTSITFKATTSKGMLNADSLIMTCEIEQKMSNFQNFQSFFFDFSSVPCKFRSLANYVAFYNNKTSCFDITDSDVSSFTSLLNMCSPHYDAGDIQVCADETACGIQFPSVPIECFTNNWVYDSLNALIETGYAPGQPVDLARIIVPWFYLYEEYELITDMHEELLKDLVDEEKDGALVYAYGLGYDVKFDIFSYQLLKDLVFGGGAIVAVYAMMRAHTGSWFVASFAMLQILLSVGVAFGVYMLILWLPFFPFLNLISIFIVIGIGSDDVFVLVDSWKQSGFDLPADHEYGSTSEMSSRLVHVIENAGSSLLTTSLTTAAAFFAVAFSSITSLRLFGIFCGIVVLVDYFFCMSFVPALLVIYESKFKGKTLCCKDKRSQVNGEKSEKFRFVERIFRDKVAPFVIAHNLKIMFVILSFVCGIGWNAFNLELTESSTFQLFRDDHPMERWELQLIAGGELDVDFGFGLDIQDNGNHLDPDDFGSLKFVDFDISDAVSQTQLINFCENLRLQSFYGEQCEDSDDNVTCGLKSVCSFELFRDWVQVPCNTTTNFPLTNSVQDLLVFPNRSECCDLNFPVTPASTFTSCMSQLADTYSSEGFHSGFHFRNGAFIALSIRIKSNFAYTDAFDPMDEFYQSIKSFVDPYIDNAPSGSGIATLAFSSEFEYYDLQVNIVESAYSSAAVSFGVAIVVLLLMTRSVRLSVSAIVTIMAIVFVLGGIFVSAGWDLNILESIIVSIAVGLAVDFTVHFTHAYLLCPDKTSRPARITYMYQTMGVSVSTGALTTFISGMALSFAETLFYYQFGIFLITTMTFSFIFSTFLLPSFLCRFGPVSQSGGVTDERNGDELTAKELSENTL